MPHMCLWPSRGSFPWAMSLIPLDTMGYKPVCCKINSSTTTGTTGLQWDIAPNHANPLVLTACANQSCQENTRNCHNLTCKLHFPPRWKTLQFAHKDCSVCVYNTEHVGGFRRLIDVHHNKERKLSFFAHEHPLGSVLEAQHHNVCVHVWSL